MASLNPARWGRQGSHNFTKDTNASTANALSKNPSNSNLIAAGNREKARQWIRDQAILFITKYSEPDAQGGVGCGVSGRNSTSTILSRLAGKLKQKTTKFIILALILPSLLLFISYY